jgi:hypothetical protein
MGTTLFAKKANGDSPFGVSDDNNQVASQIPQGNSFGAAPSMEAPPVQNIGATTMTQATPTQVAPQPMYNTQAGENAAQGADFVKNDNTDWINKKWRPVMGWVYMMTCTADFVVFPVLWSILQTLQGGQVTSQWQPLTLQGAGLYHIAMGAVLGIAAYGRTKEKVSGAA